LLNGRHQTNLGMFRQYATAYLSNHHNIEKDNFTLMVRQLAPERHGVGIEVYCFVNDTVWANYENIQADIFDHLLTAVDYFDLKLFQSPSGSDFKNLVSDTKDEQ
ncbi:MAG: mechanosensitive ion channel, partial [Bacteroidia bacterium]|nr:mechanosensitive ion channel [Bacteroidia bacterium]